MAKIPQEGGKAPAFTLDRDGGGKVSLKDFAGWSGLTITDARAAATANAGRITALGSGSDALWCTPEVAEAITAEAPSRDHVVALPGFDEFLLGYKDRSAVITREHEAIVVPGRNGVFSRTVVTGEAGAGLVKARVTVKGEVTGLDIDPSILVPSEKEVIEDLILAAIKDAQGRGAARQAEEMRRMTESLGLPPDMKLPF